MGHDASATAGPLPISLRHFDLVAWRGYALSLYMLKHKHLTNYRLLPQILRNVAATAYVLVAQSSPFEVTCAAEEVLPMRSVMKGLTSH